MIACSDVAFAYGKHQALRGVTLSVQPGTVAGLLGPNGSGKSTLLQIFATLLQPSAGSVRIFGHDVVRDQSAARRLLGVVFQQRSLDALLTVEENLAYAGALYGMRDPRARIDELLARFELTARRRHRVKTLSGGLARRVELCRALLPKPRLLLLDEPSTGLDPRARRELWAIVRGLVASEGLTAIASTHLGEEAEHCDALFLIAGGQLVAEGTPDALKRQIAEDTVRLRGPDVQAILAEVPGGELVDDEVRVRHAAAGALLVDLVQRLGNKVSAATLQRPSLEDVFVKLTGTELGDARLG